MNPLPKFGTLGDCPKCGSKNTYGRKVRFCTSYHIDPDIQRDVEHLDVTCPDCGFVRYTGCKDQLPAVNAPGEPVKSTDQTTEAMPAPFNQPHI